MGHSGTCSPGHGIGWRREPLNLEVLLRLAAEPVRCGSGRAPPFLHVGPAGWRRLRSRKLLSAVPGERRGTNAIQVPDIENGLLRAGGGSGSGWGREGGRSLTCSGEMSSCLRRRRHPDRRCDQARSELVSPPPRHQHCWGSRTLRGCRCQTREGRGIAASPSPGRARPPPPPNQQPPPAPIRPESGPSCPLRLLLLGSCSCPPRLDAAEKCGGALRCVVVGRIRMHIPASRYGFLPTDQRGGLGDVLYTDSLQLLCILMLEEIEPGIL